MSAQSHSLDGEWLDEAATRQRLGRTWNDAPGLWGALTTLDHKRIGLRYIVTAFFFFALAGLAAFVMRLQLAHAENDLVGPDLYNQLFTMHGSTMMFLFAVPIMQAVGVYFVPLMVGTRAIAFPRLLSFSYWVYLYGGLMLWISFFLNIGPDAGWFAYVPLSGPQYAPGKRVDIWAQMITYTELSGIAVAVSTIATIFKQRAPGMALNRMPLFVWAILVMSFMVLFAMPSVMVASSFLIMDRLVGTHFFNPAEGGDALLWQHLFWFFGHPEVYIIFIPALGMVSSIVATFTRRPVFAYPLMVLALIATSLFAFGLWVHHEPGDCDPDRHADLQLDRHALARQAALHDAVAVRHRLHRGFRDRWPHGRDARVGAARPAAARYVLRGRAFPLRADRRRSVSAARRCLLLVPQAHWPPAG
jgi:cytochrome c oxidase subunit 1